MHCTGAGNADDGRPWQPDGLAIINEPGPNNTRSITSIGFSGTYTVNPDGTGKMALSITVQGGKIVNVTEDFVITKTKTS